MPYCKARLECKNFNTAECIEVGTYKCFEARTEPEKAEVLASNSTLLLCCPWCGMATVLKDKSDGSDQGEFYAYVCPEDSPCNNSRMVMGFFGTKPQAIKFWNTRAI